MTTGLRRTGKINVRLLLLLVGIVLVTGCLLFVGYKLRQRMMARQALEKALVAYENQDWKTARQNFRIYLNKFVGDVENLEKYADVELSITPLDKDNVLTAVWTYRQIIRHDPENDEAYRRLARIYRYIGDFGELAHIAEMKLQHKPNAIPPHLWKAASLVQQRKFDDAINVLTDVIRTLDDTDRAAGHEYVEACNMLAAILLEQRNQQSTQDALEWTNKAITHNPQSAEALLGRSQLLRMYARPEPENIRQSLDDLAKATDVGTDDPRLKLQMAQEWLAHDEPDRAQACLDTLQDIPYDVVREQYVYPNAFIAERYQLQTEVLLEKDDRVRAVALADQILQALPEGSSRTTVLPTVVRVYLITGHIDQARKYLDEYRNILLSRPEGMQQDNRVDYLHAAVSREEGNIYEAIRSLERLVIRAPAVPEFWKMLGDCYEQTNQRVRAMSAWRQYAALNPTDVRYTRRVIQRCIQQGQWQEAARLARNAQEHHPDNIEIACLGMEARLYAAGGAPAEQHKQIVDDISDRLNALARQHPTHVDIRTLQAVIEFVKGNATLAESQLLDIIEQSDDSLRAYMQLARLYAQTDDMDKAVAACRQAIERYPDDVEPWLTLAELYISAGQEPDARQTLSHALGSFDQPDSLQALTFRLVSLELGGSHRAQGIERLQDYAAANPRDIQAREILLDLPEIRNDPQASQQLIEQIRSVEGESGLRWQYLQAALWARSDSWHDHRQEIVDLLDRCVESIPSWTQAVELLGTTYERVGDFEAAEQVYRNYISENEQPGIIAEQLLSLLERQGRTQEMQHLLSTITSYSPSLEYRRIRLALGRGDYEGAIQHLKNRIARDPGDVESYVLLAKATYRLNGNVEAAIDILDQAADIAPQSEDVPTARAAIFRAEGQIDKAAGILNDMVEKFQSFHAYWARGGFLAATGQLERAEDDFRHLIELDTDGRGYNIVATFYQTHDQIDRAVDVLSDANSRYPDNTQIRNRYMHALLARNNPEDIAAVQSILDDLPIRQIDTAEVLWTRAKLILAKDNGQAARSQAEQLLEQAITKRPRFLEAHLQLISLAAQDMDYGKVRDLAIRALATDPDNQRLLLSRALAERGLGNNDIARQLARKVLSNDPLVPEARRIIVDMALASENTADIRQAQQYVRQAIEAQPDDPQLHTTMATLMAVGGQTAQAAEYLAEQADTPSGRQNLEMQLTLARIARSAKAYQIAEKACTAAAAIEPDNHDLALETMLIAGAQGQMQRMSELARKYVSRPDVKPEILVIVAQALAMSGTTDYHGQAITMFKQALSDGYNTLETHYSLAWTAYQHGDVDLAETHYRQVLDKDPDNIQALNDLAWLLATDRQQYTQALELADRGMELQPDALNLKDTRAFILSHIPGRLDQAVAEYRQCLAMTQDDPARQARTLLALGRVLTQTEQYEQARIYLDQAHEIDNRLSILSPSEQQEVTQLLQTTQTSQ